MFLFNFTVKINLVDDDEENPLPSVSSYDPHAPVTRKGVLINFLTGKPMAIKEEDLVKA